jgi:hypothetical protein
MAWDNALSDISERSCGTSIFMYLGILLKVLTWGVVEVEVVAES